MKSTLTIFGFLLFLFCFIIFCRLEYFHNTNNEQICLRDYTEQGDSVLITNETPGYILFKNNDTYRIRYKTDNGIYRVGIFYQFEFVLIKK